MTKDISQKSETDAMAACFDALKDLTPEEQGRALDWLRSKLAIPIGATAQTGSPQLSTGGLGVTHLATTVSQGGKVSPKIFMAQKRPNSDVERVTCLALYLSQYEGKTEFKAKDISGLNTRAAGTRIGNVSQALKNASKSVGYMTSAGGGKKQLTIRGEAVALALPDRAAVKAAQDANPVRAGRKGRVAKSSRAKA